MNKYIVTDEKISGIQQVLFEANIGAKTLTAIINALKEEKVEEK